MTESGQHTYYISVGSNTAEAESNVRKAIEYLRGLLGEALSSAIYSTKPLGGKKVADYTNAVVAGLSTLGSEELNQELKAYERRCGRTPEKSKAGQIAIDLDIVTADGAILRQRDFDAEHFQRGYREMNP